MVKESPPFANRFPPPGLLTPRGGESSVGSSAETIDWFLRRWGQNLTAPADSPLGRILHEARRVEAGEPVEAEAAELPAGLRRAFLLRILDWSIRALHGRSGTLVDVHRSFLTRELLGRDSSETKVPMPGGIGTLYLAARLLQASGGKIRINGAGRGGLGHDVHWEPATGGVALIERKDRAWHVGSTESVRERALYVASKVRGVAGRYPKIPGARVLAVGFPGFVEPEREQETRDEVLRVIHARVGNTTPLPDYLIVEFLASRLSDDERVESILFTEVVDLGNDTREWRAVSPAFSRAFTKGGPLAHPAPWPIIP